MRLVQAFEQCSIFWSSILDSEVLLVLDRPNSPLAVVVVPLCDPLEIVIGLGHKLSKWRRLFTSWLRPP